MARSMLKPLGWSNLVPNDMIWAGGLETGPGVDSKAVGDSEVPLLPASGGPG